MVSNIRGERSRIDMTQRQLSERIGASEQSVRSWEAGRTKPSPDMLLRMSDLFGCTTDYLLGRSDERTGVVFFPST